MAKLDLLPRKVFEITLEDGTVVKGQYSGWSLKRFCDKKKIPLSKLDEMLGKDSISLDDVCVLILCAIEYSTRMEKKGFGYSDLDLCNWIDEMGGFGGESFASLVEHAKSELEPPKQDDEEKKS